MEKQVDQFTYQGVNIDGSFTCLVGYDYSNRCWIVERASATQPDGQEMRIDDEPTWEWIMDGLDAHFNDTNNAEMMDAQEAHEYERGNRYAA